MPKPEESAGGQVVVTRVVDRERGDREGGALGCHVFQRRGVGERERGERLTGGHLLERDVPLRAGRPLVEAAGGEHLLLHGEGVDPFRVGEGLVARDLLDGEVGVRAVEERRQHGVARDRAAALEEHRVRDLAVVLRGGAQVEHLGVGLGISRPSSSIVWSLYTGPRPSAPIGTDSSLSSLLKRLFCVGDSSPAHSAPLRSTSWLASSSGTTLTTLPAPGKVRMTSAAVPAARPVRRKVG